MLLTIITFVEQDAELGQFLRSPRRLPLLLLELTNDLMQLAELHILLYKSDDR